MNSFQFSTRQPADPQQRSGPTADNAIVSDTSAVWWKVTEPTGHNPELVAVWEGWCCLSTVHMSPSPFLFLRECVSHAGAGAFQPWPWQPVVAHLRSSPLFCAHSWRAGEHQKYFYSVDSRHISARREHSDDMTFYSQRVDYCEAAQWGHVTLFPNQWVCAALGLKIIYAPAALSQPFIETYCIVRRDPSLLFLPILLNAATDNA